MEYTFTFSTEQSALDFLKGLQYCKNASNMRRTYEYDSMLNLYIVDVKLHCDSCLNGEC